MPLNIPEIGFLIRQSKIEKAEVLSVKKTNKKHPIFPCRKYKEFIVTWVKKN